MEKLWQDLRYAARMLAKKPGFTAVTVLTLALGIGANTAIFSIVHAVLITPLPYEKPDRLVTIWESNQSRGLERSQASPVTFCDWRDQQQIFDGVAGWWYPQVNLTETGSEPERVRTIDVTDNFFDVLGARPLVGRTFQAGEDRLGGERLAVIGHDLWKRRFNSDPGAIDKTITLDGRPYSIIGVMPAGFDYPKKTEVWCTLGWDPHQHSRNARFFEVVARLAPGVSIERARASLQVVSGRIAEEFQQSNKDWGATLVPLHEQLVGDFRPALLILLGAVGLVLLIACANVANLQLARAGAREKEISIRLALGASRARLIRQLLTESLLLALVGGALGLVLAVYGGRLFVALNPVEIPRLAELAINWQILIFTLTVTLVTGIVFGLVPALQASKPDLNQSLKEGGRDSRSGASGRIRSALIVAEVAIALTLLTGAGLLLKSFVRLQQVDPGFNSENLLTANLQLPSTKYADWQKVSAFYSELIARLDAVPGVQSADVTGFLPLEGGWPTKFFIKDKPAPLEGDEPVAQHRPVSEDYFKTMGIPLVAGRWFGEGDDGNAPGVIIINEALGRRYWPEEDPLHKRLITTARQYGPLGRVLPASLEMEVIGVVGDEKNVRLNEAAEPAIYFSHRQFAYRSMSVVARTSVDPMSLTNTLRREVWAIDPDLPVSNIKTMQEQLGDSIATSRFSLMLLAMFAGLALVLASVGIYGVISYMVNQRRHEIGVRMALGAQKSDVLKMIIGHGLLLVVAGVALGIAAAVALTRVMRSLLFDVSATDPLTFAAVSMLLIGVALAACYIPARRAARVDPIIALRYE